MPAYGKVQVMQELAAAAPGYQAYQRQQKKQSETPTHAKA